MSKTSSRRPSPGPADSEYDPDISCPLCLEEMDNSDCRFKPCPCGYQICRFCWHRIREEGNERCPACRKTYTDEDIVFLPEAELKVQNKKTDNAGDNAVKSGGGGATSTGSSSPGSSVVGVLSSRKHLVEIRVIQRNLVYVIGISARVASENILKEPEYFGQFGKVIKIVVNRRNAGAVLSTEKTISALAATTTTGSAYVTYSKAEEAARAISYIDGSVFDGRVLRATYGTTKYCSFFLRGAPCPNPGCMYLHEEGDSSCSYTKEELSAGKLHLHSSLVTKGEEVGMRHFGTIMYRPPSAPMNKFGAVPIIQPTSIIVNQSSSNIEQEIEELPQLKQPTSPPINLEQCENEALSFLNRLSRWNSAAELDFEPVSIDTTNEQQQHHHHHHSTKEERTFVKDDGLLTFDPFADASSIRKCSQLSNPYTIGNGESSNAKWSSSVAPSTTVSTIAKGSLPGFDWNLISSPATCTSPATKPSEACLFEGIRKQNAVLSRLSPVGSPLMAQDSPVTFASGLPFGVAIPPTASQPGALDEIFGFYKQESHEQEQTQHHQKTATLVPTGNTSANDNGRKALDASLLEKQFFRDSATTILALPSSSSSPTSNGLVKFNQIAAAPTPAPVTVFTPPAVTYITANKLKCPPVPSATNIVPSTVSAATATKIILKRDTSKGPIRDAANISATKEPVRKQITILQKQLPASSAPSTPSSKQTPTLQNSNHFALLDMEHHSGTSSSASETDDMVSDAEREERNDWNRMESDGGNEKSDKKCTLLKKEEDRIKKGSIVSSSAKKGKKKQKKEATPTEEARVAVISRAPMPPLPSQPQYVINWPTASNQYDSSAKGPAYELMSEDERARWRKWLEDDTKSSKREEQVLRAKVGKLHSEFSQWISSFHGPALNITKLNLQNT